MRAYFLISLLIVVTFTVVSKATEPVGPVRMIAEWEPAQGTLIRWPLGIPMSLVRELAADDTLYTLVEGMAAQNAASNAFLTGGVNLSHVRFIPAEVYSIWTRDWGPQCVFDGEGRMGITDPWFDGYPWVPGCESKSFVTVKSTRAGMRGWEEDDVINGVIAAELGLPLHQLPAYCTGGNIMTDGHGRAFSTRQMLDENAPFMSVGVFRDQAESYLGITDYRILENPEVHGIQHIDCYAKLLDEETVLVKEVPTWHPEYACVEALATAFVGLTTCYGRPYEVVRIWCPPYSGNSVAAYTNCLILNTKVLVPTFGLTADSAALATLAEAMPGYEIIGFDHSNWYYYDALHCRTMGIFDPGMLRIWHRRLDSLVPPATEHVFTAEIDDRSEAGLVPGAQLVRWRLAGQEVWQEADLQPTMADSFLATIPGQTPGQVVEYYLTAADLSGRSETLPRSAPAGHYSFTVDASTSSPPANHADFQLSVHPNPFNPRTEIIFTTSRAQYVSIAIYELTGRRVTELAGSFYAAGVQVVLWDGDDIQGRVVPAGTYIVRLVAEDGILSRKIMLVR